MFVFAEAPCKDAVEMARSALADSRNEATPALWEFASIKTNDAEDACHALFHKYGLAVPVKIETMNLGSKELRKFPFIRISSWVRYLMDNGKVDRLCGIPGAEREVFLQEFWARYENLHSGHKIFEFAREGKVNLRKCLPIYAHADEGRTYKSKALLILSVHGALGRGTRAYRRRMGTRKLHIKKNPMGMNYVGSTWSTQFMFCCLLRAAMVEDASLLDRVTGVFSEDLEQIAVRGVSNSAGTDRLWVQILGLKADLPALQKMGGFVRNFTRQPQSLRSTKPCVGICFLCLAGKEQPEWIPFEDFSKTARWPSTCHQVDPWNVRPSILGEIPLERDREAAFFQTDLWHNWHNGLCKVFLANAVAMFLQEPGLIPANSIESKLQWLTVDYRQFCQRKRMTPFLKEFTRDTFAYDSAASTPQGMWSKALVSTHLMLWLGDFCGRYIEGKTEDSILLAIVTSFSKKELRFLAWLLVIYNQGLGFV